MEEIHQSIETVYTNNIVLKDLKHICLKIGRRKTKLCVDYLSISCLFAHKSSKKVK